MTNERTNTTPDIDVIQALLRVATEDERFYHKASEQMPTAGRALLAEGYIERWEPESNRFVYILTRKGRETLLDAYDALLARVRDLEAAQRGIALIADQGVDLMYELQGLARSGATEQRTLDSIADLGRLLVKEHLFPIIGLTGEIGESALDGDA